MPYIKPEQRLEVGERLNHFLDSVVKDADPGMLNYIIYRILLKWIGEDYGYADLNAATGTLHSVDKEFTRRVIVPYEQKKLHENGDI